MIDFLSSEQDYILATTELHQVFQKGVDIVENPFDTRFTIFRAFEFDRIYSENFYDGLVDFLVRRDSKEFTFYTLLPDPVEYFFPHFSKYSIGRMPIQTSYDDYINFLNLDPGNPPDALIDNAETIAMYSSKPTWGIIGSKDLEIGVAGFKDENGKNEFVSCFNEGVFVDIKTRFDDLNEMLKLQQDTKAIYFQMIKNYSRK